MGFNKKSSGEVELVPNARLTGISAGSAPKDAVNFNQVFSADNSTAGNNTHTGTETFSNATGVTTDTVTERTAGAGVTVDSLKIKDGGASNTAGTTFAGFFYTAAQNNITAGTGGAISVANYLTTINTDAGGDAFTIAAGGQIGQLKKVLLVADGGGDATITLTGYTSIVMNDAADYVVLIWNGSAWFVLENSGCTVNA
jgi:hypothetical protein